MIAIRDLAWAAGFLEGEGSFNSQRSPRVSAAQVQREPLERLQALFGGRIAFRRTTAGFKKGTIWVWALSVGPSVEVMMTLWTFMSPRRRGQIEAALENWKQGRHLRRRNATHCIHGHELAGHNAMQLNGRIRCRECINSAKRRYREIRNRGEIIAV